MRIITNTSLKSRRLTVPNRPFLCLNWPALRRRIQQGKPEATVVLQFTRCNAEFAQGPRCPTIHQMCVAVRQRTSSSTAPRHAGTLADKKRAYYFSEDNNFTSW